MVSVQPNQVSYHQIPTDCTEYLYQYAPDSLALLVSEFTTLYGSHKAPKGQ